MLACPGEEWKGESIRPRSLIVNELGIDPVRLVPILHYDGTPITARFIVGAVGDRLDTLKVRQLRKAVS